MTDLNLTLRTQQPALDERGNHIWRAAEQELILPVDRVAVILCDVWDGHYCAAAVQRLEAMVPRMNRVLHAMRDAGSVIVHCPSDTMDVYADTRARKRALSIAKVHPPDEIQRDDPPLPIDSTQETCCDTPDSELAAGYTKQHDGIDIDHGCDYLCDDGPTVYSIVRHHDIQRAIILGVHTNMCILHRTFGIKPMTRLGVSMMLVRDLTDAMYNPLTWPYVSHDDGTRLVIEYIEKFWCPTIYSGDLVG